jgi:hypothetical protein
MDWLPGGGMWSMVDHGQRRGQSSPEYKLTVDAVVWRSLRLHGNEEGDSPVLTKVFGVWLDGEARPTTVESEWRQ